MSVTRFAKPVMSIGFPVGEDGDPPNPDPPKDEGKLMTQAQIDKIVEERLAKDRKELSAIRAQNAKTVEMLETLKKNREITDTQRTQLEEQIDHLNKTIMTKEQLTAKEKKELKDALDAKLNDALKQADHWKKLHDESTVKRAIFDEVREKAFDPNQFIDFLGPKTKLIEELNEGQPTGRYSPVVSFIGRDKDGNSVPMELSVADTIKEMEKMTDKYGNLFKSGLTGGLGGKGSTGSGGKEGITDEVSSSFENYMKHRAEVMKH